MERVFDHELDELKSRLLHMGGWGEEMVRKAMSGLLSRDAALLERLAEDDRQMDQLELEIEEQCLTLLALRQPIARDLRSITATMHIAVDLERVGDHAINIADCARQLAAMPAQLPAPVEVRQLAEAASGMLHRALDAYVAHDPQAAATVCRDDDTADQLEESIFGTMQERMCTEPSVAPACIQWILVGRNLERVADLATNVAEEVIFIANARVIKHHHETA